MKSKEMLRDEYLDIQDDLAPGETARCNHLDCPAGEDTRARLYFTRDSKNTSFIKWYCHNCSEGGYVQGKPNFYRVPPKVPFKDAKKFAVPSLLVPPFGDGAPLVLQARLKKYISEGAAEAHGFKYDPSSHAIYQPIWRLVECLTGYDIPEYLTQGLMGYQLRMLNPHSPYRYITNMKDKESPIATVVRKDVGSAKCYAYVVEDILSAISIMEHTVVNCDILCNYGTKPDPLALSYLDKQYDKLTVWFDNDGDKVMENAHTMARVAGMVCHANRIFVEEKYAGLDPKDVLLLDVGGTSKWIA